MFQNSLNNYREMHKESLSGRELEASILTRAAHMLRNVQENWEAPERDEKLLEAIKFNQKVWSLFQAELSDPDNPLPLNLKQDILNLSIFVDKRLFAVLANPCRDDLTIAIDINLNIAAGLMTKPA